MQKGSCEPTKSPPKQRAIFFATSNVNKFNEARRVLARYRITVCMLRARGLEIQSNILEEIAQSSALDAFRKCHLPIIVEDAGLFVEALNGFPGPYTAYAYRTIGNEGLLRIMKDIVNRGARFESVVAYCSAQLGSPKCFMGKADGRITEKQIRRKNEPGFGFDPIFKPRNSDKTFAEMTIVEKNRYSHRAKALCEFAEWYRKLC